MDISAIAARAPVVPVLTIERAVDAVPLARALVKGDLPMLEITFRTDAAFEALRTIAAEVPDAIVGAGTVLNAGQLEQAQDAGARFAVSPGCTPALAEAAKAAGLPFLPGVQTVSDAMVLFEQGFRLLKFFPAESMGGLGWLRSVAASSGRPALLPDWRDRRRNRASLSRPSQRCLHRGLLAGAAAGCGCRRLGEGRAAGCRSLDPQTTLARNLEWCFNVSRG